MGNRAVVNEHILGESFECHVVNRQHKGALAALYERQEIGTVVCWVKNIVSSRAQRVECSHAIHRLVDASAYAVVLWEPQTFVLLAVCLGNIVILAEIHGELALKLILGQVVYKVGKIACDATEPLECKHLIVVKNLFHRLEVLRDFTYSIASRNSCERHRNSAIIYIVAATTILVGSRIYVLVIVAVSIAVVHIVAAESAR